MQKNKKKDNVKMRDMKPRKDPKAGGGFGNKNTQGGGSSIQGGGIHVGPSGPGG